LNYFAFVRLGRGRQKGATYFNENVMVLEDILRLKRVIPEATGAMRASGDHNERNNAIRSAISCPKVQLLQKHPSICSSAVTKSPPTIAVPTEESVTMSIKVKKRRLSYHPLVIVPVSPSESGDEGPSRENSHNNCFAQRQQLGSFPVSGRDANRNMSPQSLQNEELLVCAALVNMGQGQAI
jgi:hypothetical protein